MNYTQHVSGETLDDFLESELSGRAAETVRLHLSYCPLCQEKRDALLLMQAVERMRDKYESTDNPAREHVSDKVFERFWRGEVRGEEYLERISGHCIVCRRCQQRRHDVMLRLGVESSRTRGQLVVGVGLLLWARVWKRRRGLAVAALLLIGGVVLFRNTRDRLFHGYGDRAAAPARVATPDAPKPLAPSRSPDGDAPAAPPHSTPAPPSDPGKTSLAPLMIAQSRKRNEPTHVAPADQRINLSGLSEADEIRGEDGGKQVTYLKVSPSRVGPTSLRIELPGRSTGGVYVVSIQEQAGLRALVESKAHSPDGKVLIVTFDLKDVPEGEHLLCLVREGAEPGEEEYIGHYPLLLLKQAAPRGGMKTSP